MSQMPATAALLPAAAAALPTAGSSAQRAQGWAGSQLQVAALLSQLLQVLD
jgi:hypothetical protein